MVIICLMGVYRKKFKLKSTCPRRWLEYVYKKYTKWIKAIFVIFKSKFRNEVVNVVSKYLKNNYMKAEEVFVCPSVQT